MSRTPHCPPGLALLVLAPRSAHADLTAFIGAAFSGTPQDTIVATTSHTSLTRGLSVGVGLIIVGFEFEWARTQGEDSGEGSCQAPGFRDSAHPRSRPSWATSCADAAGTGPGAALRHRRCRRLPGTIRRSGREHHERGHEFWRRGQISCSGPLRVRVDYRIFKLSGDAVYATPQRFYVGANSRSDGGGTRTAAALGCAAAVRASCQPTAVVAVRARPLAGAGGTWPAGLLKS